ncbi:metallophosphoesterase family protein [Haliea atlantica]
MTTLLHISDTHFGTERPSVMEALVRFAQSEAPDCILFTGDITQRARRHQFAAARRFIGRLSAPVIAVPGNHDIPLFNLPARLLNPFGNYRRYIGRSLEPQFESPTLQILGVNTTRPSRHVDGAVSSRQIARVSDQLRAAQPGQLRVVIQHHPVRAIEQSDLHNLLIGHEAAVPAWVDAGMDLLLAGHIHLPYIRPLQGHSGRQALTIQAGTALSSRTRGETGNSLNLIRYTPPREQQNVTRRCMVERWDFEADRDAFCLADRQTQVFT